MTKLSYCTQELSHEEMRSIIGGKTWLRMFWDWLTGGHQEHRDDYGKKDDVYVMPI